MVCDTVEGMRAGFLHFACVDSTNLVARREADGPFPCTAQAQSSTTKILEIYLIAVPLYCHSTLRPSNMRTMRDVCCACSSL